MSSTAARRCSSGSSRRPGETFTVVDLFGADPGEGDNAAENRDSYPGLTRQAFEDNYRRLLGGELPTSSRA